MINFLTQKTRSAMDGVAIVLDRATRSKISPNLITLISLLGHFVVFVAIIDSRFDLAALMILIFGLMDALDGSLARLQNKASATGMLLDATSDRAKEFIIYLALIFLFADSENVAGVMASAIAMGGSFMFSYVKAKGETAIASTKKSHATVNRAFSTGLMQYQVRMAILIIGLFAGHPTATVAIIAVMTWISALVRLVDIIDVLQVKTKK